ncbi:HisA/HisF-related TIM barrel protein [Paraburkholderia hospita]|uniref:Histidine biosynthesis protein n=1 Tax=Paraburkholderia hospita TaxID=169430 RepID=A0AAN1MNY2_9BURK|nr:HisA/HisF-related TIM barrel protein [Paraburkholderia hospita]AUT74123.1 phosphoribosylformimino-5-aminoimidazole carboxamide ribotide isomerase [Paraburkholderia hospita]EIN03043.1 histidine biosynthesis protein [Paraburkholderia hospita]OUL77960.1 phosphoribosylformimino-5-aminoimidazole carboxamide ribotide isomerase [Paraburkholderia hospita]OUL83375.1 phosphoribosylformimino-5-aminoimidazole carboxamide ribotide isomerase [Paraburkholderia hospita]SEH60913.1 phosphoribosylformimino-5-
MQVIPVLDLLDGHAVRAIRGDRANYRPIQSSLCATSEPLPIARALVAATAAPALYVADLGAIMSREADPSTLAALAVSLAHPHAHVEPHSRPFEIWLDAGFADFPSMLAHLSRIAAATGSAHARIVPVFGSESLHSLDALQKAEAAGYAPILSLDHRGRQLIAAPELAQALRAPASWPSRVIVMTLDQVGADDGPDLDTFNLIHAQAGQRSIIGAGGIRHCDDLDAAARSGAYAWLIASALHDGRLRTTDATRSDAAT